MADPWKKHPNGIYYRVGSKNNELLYQIQGTDRWLKRDDFDRYCEKKSWETPRDRERHETLPLPTETQDHQGPLRGPCRDDACLFPAEGDPRESQSRDLSKGQNYEVHKGDARLASKQYASTRRASAYESSHGTTSTLISRTRSADTGISSQPTSRMVNSADQSEQPLPAQKPQLGSLARSFASLGLNEYSKSSRFISDNPSIVAKSEIDALIANASFAEKAGQSTIAKTCIHQALLLRACKDAGPNGISSFFQGLTARDGGAKDALMKDVQKVYESIQQAIRTGQQSQRPDSEPRERKLPVVLQTTERTISQNPYVPTPRPLETTQSQTPVFRDREGQLFYTDNQGNVLRPASSRHDPDRHRPVSEPAETTEKIASVSRGKESQSGAGLVEDRGDGRTAPGRASHRTSVSSPSEPLPTLPEHGRLESTKIGGTAGNVEKLDYRYRLRSDAKRFFECGRVFALLWHESVGGGGGPRKTELSDPVPMRGRFGEEVYSHIRRMVVVKEGHGFCLCLPINTYNGQGVTKHGLSDEDKRAHSIVYMTDTRPSCLPEEERDLTKKPIAVEKASDDQKLDTMSRLNFKKIYTIEHNVKVMSVGKVTRDSLQVLLKYWIQSLTD